VNRDCATRGGDERSGIIAKSCRFFMGNVFGFVLGPAFAYLIDALLTKTEPGKARGAQFGYFK
jgi:hypothetical protein